MSDYVMGTNHVDRVIDDGALAFVGRAGQPVAATGEHASRVPVDVYETASYLVVRAEVPGAGLDDLDATVDRNVLQLSGCFSKVRTNEAERLTWHCRGIEAGRFAETVPLPVPVDVESGLATYGDGILEVQFPKADPAGPKRIPIRRRQALASVA